MPDKKIEKKAEEKKPLPKLKRTYTIVADAFIPIKVRYTIMAEDEHEAAELFKKQKFSTMSVDRPQVHISHIKEFVVYLGGTINRLLSIKLR